MVNTISTIDNDLFLSARKREKATERRRKDEKKNKKNGPLKETMRLLLQPS